MTHPELGLFFSGLLFYFSFFFLTAKKGKSPELTSAQDEHPASAGEKRETYSTVTRAHTHTDSLNTLGRCHIPVTPGSSQGGKPQLVSPPAAQNRAHSDMLGPQ